MKKTIWVTGAYGFIGRFVAKHFAKEGNVVFGIGHSQWKDEEASEWGISSFVSGDINNENLSILASQSGIPDIVIHLAGGSSVGVAIDNPKLDFFRTVGSTIELLEWIRLSAMAAKMVAVSSAAVYGAGYDGTIREGAQLTPYSPYGHHKLMMEDVCRSYANSYGISCVVPRLFSVYGPQLKKQLLWDVCNKVSLNEGSISLGGSGNELRDWIHIDDVARALVLVSDYASNKVPVFNVGSGFAISVREVVTALIQKWPNKCEVHFSGLSRKGDPFSLIADPSDLFGLGFELKVPMELGISDYVSWYLSDEDLK